MEIDFNILVKIGGIYHLGLAGFHLFFWKLFNWKQDLVSLTPINRAVMQILNLCLTFLFLLFGCISLIHSTALLTSDLGRVLLIGFSAFWFLRMIEQIVFFGLRNRVTIFFTLLFMSAGVLYLLPAVFSTIE